MAPVKCDGDGNIYLRYPSRSPSTFDVARISPDGSTTASYRYYEQAELKNAFAEDFAIANDGKVYVLLQFSQKKMIVAEFSSNGQFENKTELLMADGVDPSQLVVLNDGSFFISGIKIGGGQQSGEPFNVIFTSSGKMAREFSFKGDVSAAVSPKSTSGPADANPSVRFGRALLGQDGYLYVMRATSPAIIYVISPGGEVARTLKLQAPIKRGIPVAMMVNAGRLAIEFSDPDAQDVSDTTIRVVSATTGDTVADYKIVRELTEALACYTNDKFTFLGNADGWPAIMQASTR